MNSTGLGGGREREGEGEFRVGLAFLGVQRRVGISEREVNVWLQLSIYTSIERVHPNVRLHFPVTGHEGCFRGLLGWLAQPRSLGAACLGGRWQTQVDAQPARGWKDKPLSIA